MLDKLMRALKAVFTVERLEATPPPRPGGRAPGRRPVKLLELETLPQEPPPGLRRKAESPGGPGPLAMLFSVETLPDEPQAAPPRRQPFLKWLFQVESLDSQPSKPKR